MKHLVRITIWTVFTVYLFTFVLLRVPAVQTMLADNISEALAVKLGTKVEVGRIDLRLFNRIIIDDMTVYDQQKKRMLHTGRASATIDLLPLMEGEVSISSVQLFGMKANLYKNDNNSPINCQFVIDSLKSKDTTSTSTLNLSIASLVIRNGNIVYDQLDKPRVKGKFSPYHINISKLSSHLILYRQTNDSIEFSLKRLSLNEASGIRIYNLTTEAKATTGAISIKEMMLKMPGTSIIVPSIKVTYAMEHGTIRTGSLHFNGQIKAERLSPADFSAIISNKNIAAIPTIKFAATADGSDKTATATFFAYSTDNSELSMQVSANARDILESPKVDILVSKCSVTERFTNAMASLFSLPDEVKRLGAIDTKGRFRWQDKHHFAINADINASKVGKVSINGEYNTGNIKATVLTSALDIARITDNSQFGTLRCNLDVKARTDNKWNIIQGKAKGTISELSYNNYTYQNIKLDLAYDKATVSGKLNIQDPNISLDIDGKAGIGKTKSLQGTVTMDHFCPSALNLTNRFGNDRFAFSMKANAQGSSVDNVAGVIALDNISITNPSIDKTDAFLDNITMAVERTEDGRKQMTLSSDFAYLHMIGNFTVSTIVRSFTNLAAKHLPAIAGLPAAKADSNDFRFEANIQNMDFLKRIVNIPVKTNSPLKANGFVNSITGSADISLSAPSLQISNTGLSDTDIHIWTENDAIRTVMKTMLDEKNGKLRLNLDCTGEDNNLHTILSWDNMRTHIFRGQLNTVTRFTAERDASSNFNVSIPHSTFEVGDTLWNIHSRGINYDNGRLYIDHLAVENENQHLYVNGTVSKNITDTIAADLKDINIRYVLDLVNFHSVDFDGRASGHAVAAGVMHQPSASASLAIKDFRFESGRLGTMFIDADYDNGEGQININGKAVPEDTSTPSQLLVKGNISPARNTIDLAMDLQHTPLEFMQSFCGSFLHDIDMQGTGNLRLHGPLDAINLEGKVTAGGAFTLTSTNCRYTMDNDTVKFIPDDILFNAIPLKDRYGNVALVSGGIHHHCLGRISYDITAKTQKFLAYDFPVLAKDETFCGYALINGTIGVHGKGNEVNITADCTPLEESYFTYDAASPEALKSQDFITWGSADTTNATIQSEKKTDNGNITATTDSLAAVNAGDRQLLDAGNDRANIRLNFLINVRPSARLHLIMDETTGDDVNLFGAGTLRIQYYNKGSLDIFGNYAIDHGTYKMTIQNLMRRDFTFQKGGTIAFAGDPYNAMLNMQAAYMLNSVSLSDLNIGSSFKSNNVPVNCLMNITGTPEKPKVDFGLNLPSLSADAKQMVYSVINSEEEMNQQVLYLLAIGRFYSQATDNENTQRTKQSTLAMQSFLSGTLSQQLNNILGQMIGNTNWSVGANITPGTDGFNNAVYEGLLSGRMFNNRLLFNGQFGYRDNINTDTQNFIGDFTIQYLLTPNGNFSLKMYNQSNDRYFTRNSLNTQGIGVVIQKEFGK